MIFAHKSLKRLFNVKLIKRYSSEDSDCTVEMTLCTDHLLFEVCGVTESFLKRV